MNFTRNSFIKPKEKVFVIILLAGIFDHRN